MWKYIAPGVVAAAGIVAACSGAADRQAPDCMSMVSPGTLVAVPGIDLKVRDSYGQGEAIGTTAVITRSSGDTMQAFVQDTLNILSAFDVAGDFRVTLSRRYYNDVTIPKVTVTTDGCLVNTTAVPVTMQLAAGAPPLRAIAIAGAVYLAYPRAQAQLLAHFDADPTVSRAVTWTVNDTTLATIDANGVVTARCPNAGGTVKATATSVATPTVFGDASMGVSPATTCP